MIDLQFHSAVLSDGARHLVWRGHFPEDVARQYQAAWPEVRRLGGFPFGIAPKAETFVRAVQAALPGNDSVLFVTSRGFSTLAFSDGATRSTWSTDSLTRQFARHTSEVFLLPCFDIPERGILCACRMYSVSGSHVARMFLFDPRRDGESAFTPIAESGNWPQAASEVGALYATDDPSVFLLIGSVEGYGHHTEFSPVGTCWRIDLQTMSQQRLKGAKVDPAKRIAPLCTTDPLFDPAPSGKPFYIGYEPGKAIARLGDRVLWTRDAPEVTLGGRPHASPGKGVRRADGVIALFDSLDPRTFDLNVYIPART